MKTSPPEDDWLDTLLHRDAQAQAHLDDAGFSNRVMEHLPARRNRPAAWVLPLATALGCLLALHSLGGAEYVFNAIAALITEGEFGSRQLSTLVTVAVLYAVALGGAWGER
ncbi:MAG: DUF5056 domain-containing protein [Betaproteobacteria bacterium]|nr:DUF5056 domain-containing protein [Betaproteobacteria bacterium]